MPIIVNSYTGTLLVVNVQFLVLQRRRSIRVPALECSYRLTVGLYTGSRIGDANYYSEAFRTQVYGAWLTAGSRMGISAVTERVPVL